MAHHTARRSTRRVHARGAAVTHRPGRSAPHGCPACGWRATGDRATRRARWCGRCGAALGPPTRQRDVHSLASITIAAIGGLIALGALFSAVTGGTTVDAPPTDRAADDDGSGIGLDRLADARDLPVATDHDCTLSDGSHLACGPTLAADGVAPTQLLTHDGLLLLRRDGDLTAFGLPDLEQRWRTALDPDIERWSLQDGDGLVLLTTPTTVHALDPHDGQVRWRSSPARLTTADGTAGDQRRSSFHPIETWVRDGTVLALDAAGTLTALAAEDGSQRWSVGDAGRRPVATPQGVVVFDDHGARAWSTNDPQPRWEVVDALLDVRRPVARDAVPGPMPLTRNRGLLDLTTGAITTDARLGATRFLVLPEVTIELRWPSGTKRAEVAALEPDGTTRWRRSDQPISCCDTTAALTATDEVAITSTDRHPVIYDLDDGGAEVLPARGGAELIGLDATTAVWRADDGLVATDRHSGRERFRSSGELRSIDPLLIAVDDGLVVPDERARARDSHVRRPTARTLTAHPA